MKHPLKELWVELKPSLTIKGEIGLFAARLIKKGQKIYTDDNRPDDFITREEFTALSPDLQKKVLAYTMGRPDGFFTEEGIDFNDLPASQFINHSCDGNVGFDDDEDFIALRDIEKGEELFCDYGLLEAAPDFVLDCLCGSPRCRKQITGMDWKDPAFQREHRDHMHTDLRLPLV